MIPVPRPTRVFKVFTGPVGSCKTQRIADELEDCLKARESVLVIKHTTDVRWEEGADVMLSTHFGMQYSIRGQKPLTCNSLLSIPDDIIAPIHNVFIDELQFWGTESTKHADLQFERILHWYTNLGANIYIAGLNMWHTNSLVYIMARATSMANCPHVMYGTCILCGSPQATCSPKLRPFSQLDPKDAAMLKQKLRESFDSSDEPIHHDGDPSKLVEVGGSEKYVPSCIYCYPRINPPSAALASTPSHETSSEADI